MKIGNVTTPNNIFAAPLAGYTDFAMRSLAAEYGAGVTYTEMVSAKGMCYGNDHTSDMLHRGETEVIVGAQLFGSEPYYIARALEMEELRDFQIIDINMGCPVPKIVNNHEGSYLLTQPIAAGAIVEAAKRYSGGRPVTVKIRIGVKDAVGAVDFAKRMQDSGADAVTVHGRTRAEGYSGQVHLDTIAEVKAALTIPVIGNGDVTDVDSLRAMLSTGVDGVMVGRASIGNPYIYAELCGTPVSLTPEILRRDVLRHIELMHSIRSDIFTVANMKKHICYYAKHTARPKEVKAAVCATRTMDELYAVVDTYFA